MKIQKTVIYDIDIAKIRARYQRADISYTKAERKKLLALVDLFEAGKFSEALAMTEKWSTEDIEMIVEDIWDMLQYMTADLRPFDNHSATVSTVECKMIEPLTTPKGRI